jgi:tRNA(adenine34) deaminase
MRDLYWMNEAILLAKKASLDSEVPVGAVIVTADDKIIGVGCNEVISRVDSTAHAEILAIQEASKTLGNYRLDNATMYVTLEPCCMCAGALIHARVKRLVFATRDFKAGAAGSVYNLLKGYPLNHKVQIDEGILQRESAQLLADFFINRR